MLHFYMNQVDTSSWKPCAHCKQKPKVTYGESSPLDSKTFLLLSCKCDTEVTFQDSPLSRETLKRLWERRQVLEVSSRFGF